MNKTRLPSDNEDEVSSIRVDKLLYYLRFAKSRSIAQKICETGYVRMDGRRTLHGHDQVQIGSVITMPRSKDVMIIKICDIPKRRGPSLEAQSHYILLNKSDG